ncbi:hypothetical protein [Virgibacillus senegalensis]|uniref:hypothetical protein n=1 Tax=Virgibacillus senegalensis TaxID=1499679 RepID=UPI00069E776F|nr:hypothetical protein [Virgibacillus senegalensis]
MEQNERKTLYFYLGLGYTGLLLTGLGALRFISIYHDKTGHAFSLFAFMMLSAYIRYTERKLEVGSKVKFLGKAAFVFLFFLLSLWLYL